MRDPVETSVAPSSPLSSRSLWSRIAWPRVLLWIATCILTALFLFIGVAKLLSSEAIRQQFAHWGYPRWFMYANGVVETVCALILLVPRIAVFGAVIIMADMIGANVTHATHGEFTMLPVPLVVLIIASVIARARWRDRATYRRP